MVLQDVKGRVENMVRAASEWLDRRSAFYTRVAGFEVTNRTVCRINGITVTMQTGAIAVEQATLAMMAVTWWLTRRLNAADMENESKDNEEQKGGVR